MWKKVLLMAEIQLRLFSKGHGDKSVVARKLLSFALDELHSP